jgi:hypothetical protein
MARTVIDCFGQLQPILDDVTRLAKAMPLEGGDRVRLLSMVAAHFFGVSCEAMRERDPELAKLPIRKIAREMADAILEDIDPVAPWH